MEYLIAKIALAKAVYSIDKPYDYLVPSQMEARIQTGMRVLVPFGSGNRGSDGMVLALKRTQDAAGLKQVLTLLDEEPVLDSFGVQLALWMREYCFCTVYDSVKAMLPAGLYYALRDSVVLSAGLGREASYELVADSNLATALVEMLWTWGGKGDMEQIRAGFGTKDPNPAIRLLLERKVATLESSAQRGIGDKTERLAVLAMPAEEAMDLVKPKRKTAPLRYAVTELLCQLGEAGTKELCYFTGASMQTIRSLEKSGVLTIQRQEVFRKLSMEEVEPASPVTLNQEQQQAFSFLYQLLCQPQSCAALLYGVTGSGKTQVYIRLIQEALALGKGAILLVPEIGLTPQMVRIFSGHFGKQVAILHSSLRTGERYDEWKRVRRGEARLVIGTRSAVFAPVKDLGLIILDEEQEGSYKSENNPRYHARDVAKYRCVQHQALLLLGSATPSLETMYRARQGTYHCVTLSQRFNQRTMPQVHIVDMKEELRAGNGGAISRALKEELTRNLERGEQSILFLNRRGASRMVSCGMCGEVPSCPRCSVKLTYHSANQRLMCHYCGFSQKIEPQCPQCGGEFQFIGVGTQRVQEELEELFPQTPVLRMDADTITASRSHEAILDEFQKKKIPILIGTQMVAKGLDFENVTLVGAILADQSLFVDDFRAGERTFSLLTQVVGRAGRGNKEGRALIQTYTPENDVIRFSAQQNYELFYQAEIPLRQLCQTPPFQDIFLITVSGLQESGVLQTCFRLRQGLDASLPRLVQGPWQLLGPAPAAVAKINHRYRYRLTLSAKNTKAVRLGLAQMLQQAQKDRENRGISIYVDLNPY